MKKSRKVWNCAEGSIQVAWSKARACGRSLAGIVGSNLTGACTYFSCECCVLSGRNLYVGLNGALQNVACVSVISKPQQRGVPGPLGTVAPGGSGNGLFLWSYFQFLRRQQAHEVQMLLYILESNPHPNLIRTRI